MKALRNRRFVPVALPLLAGLALPARAQTAHALPQPPPATGNLSFADELAGRRLLWAARDAYRNAPALRFEAKWVVKADPGTKTETTTGTETVAAEPAARRLALTTESLSGGDRQVRRAVANGSALLATRFHARPGGKAPVREFVRLPVTAEDTLPGVLRQVQVAPSTRAGVLLLDPEWTVRGVTRRGKQQTLGGAPADEVWETEAARPRGSGDGARATTTRHYLLDAKTHLLLRYEEWVSAEPQGAAARRPGGARPRVTYRREDYQGARAASAPLPAALFGQSLPRGYRETALPSVSLPDADGLRAADREARQLLTRWTRAQERLLTYSAQIEVTTRRENETAPPRQDAAGAGAPAVLYTAWLHRPGRARLTRETTGGGRQDRPLLAVLDGRQMFVHDRGRGQTRTAPLPDPSDVTERLDRTGFDDEGDALRWLFAPPIGDYVRAVYRGRQSVGGEAVDLLELVQNDVERRRGRQTQEEKTTVTVALGADGLPRQIERRRERTETGFLTRDTDVDRIVTVRYRQVRVDEEPPRGSFTFEPPPGAAGNGRERGALRGTAGGAGFVAQGGAAP